MATTITGNTLTTTTVESDVLKLDGSTTTLYEEGNWTPIVNSGMTYSSLEGTYFRTGNWVTVHFRAVNLAQGSATSAYFQIDGLPYAIDSTSKRYSGSFGEIYTISMTTDTQAHVAPATENNGIRLFAFSHAAGVDVRANTTGFNGDYLQFQLTYRSNL